MDPWKGPGVSPKGIGLEGFCKPLAVAWAPGKKTPGAWARPSEWRKILGALGGPGGPWVCDDVYLKSKARRRSF